MDLPVGTVVETLQETKPADFKKKLQILKEQGFTGYVIETVEGVYGGEEAILFFKAGEVIACLFSLESNGYEVLEAPGGKQGLTLLKAGGVDLVLCDFFMPIRSGGMRK